MKQWYTIPNGLNRNQAFEGREYALKKLIEFRCYPLDMILDKLLIDKTTGKRIIWATDGYSEYGDNYCDRYEISTGSLIGINPVLIQPRAFKTLETQQQRTKSKAEVFTPSWIVNKMVNHLDEEWFGRPDVFNIEKDQTWDTKTEKIDLKGKKWKDYVDRSVLEITCGEAPFIVSRYNASTGEIIPIEKRIGILDRKLRIVTENTDNEEDWIKWVLRAYESVYGYEYQGDNLLIGRINLLMTFVDYYQSIWNKEADNNLLTAIANIITWNFWQMDGLSGTVPLGVPQPVFEQMTLFDVEDEQEEKAPLCKVRKWRAKKTILYKEIEAKEGKDMGKKKWDIVIGNPPYQLETTDKSENNGQKSRTNIFHKFQIAADKIAQESSVMIYPAGRWIHRSGKGLAEFGLSQINDKHLEKLIYFPKSKELFGQAADLSDGISIVIKDYKHNHKEFQYEYIRGGQTFRETLQHPGEELLPLDPANRSILAKIDSFVDKNSLRFLHDQVLPRSLFGIESDYIQNHKELSREYHPTEIINPRTEIKVLTNDKAGKAGRAKWFVIPKTEIKKSNDVLNKWKVVVSSANAGGQKRDNQLEIIDNQSAFGRSRVALAAFETKTEAENFFKYMKTYIVRFAFLMTDEALTSLAKKVPDLIDYSNQNTFIDFTKDLDNQLFSKLSLSSEEIQYVKDYVDNWRDNFKAKKS